MAQEKYVAYVGTYTHENSVGIHIYDVDVTKGYMKERKVVPINNPSDLVVSRNRKFLHCSHGYRCPHMQHIFPVPYS